jgi:hypothetical protein
MFSKFSQQNTILDSVAYASPIDKDTSGNAFSFTFLWGFLTVLARIATQILTLDGLNLMDVSRLLLPDELISHLQLIQQMLTWNKIGWSNYQVKAHNYQFADSPRQPGDVHYRPFELTSPT